LERIFIIEELLGITFGEDESEDEGEGQLHAIFDFMEPAPLPKQYNITFIDVIIRDPFWVYAFWEIKNNDKELYEKSPDFGGYFLKVRNIRESSRRDAGDSFIVQVGTGDAAWYLGFPPSGDETDVVSSGERRYQVELRGLRGNDEFLLAFSRPITLPAFRRPLAQNSLSPLAWLSGADDFRIIRSTERLSRVKRGGSSRGE
jgi:hypothetical protein